MRITEKNLESLIKHLNELTGSPVESYIKDELLNKYVAQPRNYHLSYAYGGVSLHRMCNTGGGADDVFSCGHTTKRDLWNRTHAFIKGITLSNKGE